MTKIVITTYGIVHITFGVLVLAIFVFAVTKAGDAASGVGSVGFTFILSGIGALRRAKWGLFFTIIITILVTILTVSVMQDFFASPKWDTEYIVFLPLLAIFEWFSTVVIVREVKRRKNSCGEV